VRAMITIPKLKIGDLVEVTWFDSSTADVNGWQREDELIDNEILMEIKTASYFYGRVKDHINLAADRTVSEEYRKLINRRLSIPLGCITNIRKIGE